MLFEAKQAAGVVHQHIGIEHEGLGSIRIASPAGLAKVLLGWRSGPRFGGTPWLADLLCARGR
jgi:hypothetical protein